MARTVWVTIRKVSNDCVAHSVGFDTDDTSLGMAIGFIDGWAAAHGGTKVDVSRHGLERYDILDVNDVAIFTVAVTTR